MADTPIDHDPQEQRLRIVAGILEDFEAGIIDAVSSCQLALSDPMDLPRPECFYTARAKAWRDAECLRQAKDAVRSFMKDKAVFLPLGLEPYFDLPGEEL